MASLLTLLTVWLALKYAYGLGSCDNLKAFEENKEVNSSFFCVEEFTDEECLPFVDSFNRSHLPPAFHSHSLTIDKPSSINLDLLTLDYKDPRHQISYKSPGARLQWTPPVSELSRSKLEGFLILWKNEKTISCRLFKFNTSHQKLIKMMNFSYVVDNLHDDSQYTFTVYSLPPPEYKYRLDSNRFAQMIMKTFTKYESGTDPAFWAPSLSVKIWPSTGTLDVNFLLSPPEFNFTLYEIHLLKRSHSANDFYQMKNYSSENSTNFNSQGNARFENLPTDSYQIKIIITDPFWQRPGQCYCWRRATQDECVEGVCSYMCSGGRCCQGSCKAVSTQWIKLDVAAEEISTLKLQETTEAMNHDDSATPRTGEVSLQGVTGRLLSDGEIVGVVLGSAVIIIVFVSLIYIFHKPLSSTAVIKTLVCIKKFPHRESNSAIGSTTKPKELSASLAPKKLYMMSADDHDYHIQMVEKLVRFLELHCHCQVIYPANAKDFHKFDSPYSWFMSHISSSDHIICIISVGAQKLTEAYLNQKIFRDRELRPEGDLFTECLKHIYRDTLARDRVINIYFGPTEPELKYFSSPFTFDIPKNISEFFQKLHSLSSKDRRTFSSQLSMLRDNIPLIPEGAELLAAIKVSRQYEESNPDWLIKNFGVETDIKRAMPTTLVNKTPKLETMLSISSGDSGINDMGPRSVSASDLCSCRSPTGVEDHSGLHNELGVDQDKELELDIYTIPYSSYMDDHSDKSCASLNTADTGHNPHSYSANPGSGTEYDHFIGTVVPPGNASERTELLRAPQMNINKPHILQTDRGIYSIENQMPLDCMLILPPETMSAIDNMSEAFLNINKNVDFYNKNQMPPDHMFILPPETMSTVDNMSEAFINVNKNIDNYNNWNNQQGHC